MTNKQTKYTVNGDSHITFTWQEQTYIRAKAKDSSIAHLMMFFQMTAGMCVGHCAQGALRMAKAVEFAEAQDCEFRWFPDDDADYSFVDTWPEADQKRWKRDDHEAWCCQLVTGDGMHHLASLSGIIDPDASYRKVIEGELALEAQDVLRALADCPLVGVTR